MQFKLFNATTMHNSTEKCKQFKKIKNSDLNQNKSDFFDFFLNHDFSNPVRLEFN